MAKPKSDAPVLLAGSLDTKGAEMQFLRDRLRAAGLHVLDIGSLNSYTIMVSSILYFHRNTTGAALISSKY